MFPQSTGTNKSRQSNMSELCWYCLAEMVACYEKGCANWEYYNERLQKAKKIEVECDCTIPLWMRKTAAGYCKCKCSYPGRTIIICYNQKLEPIRIEEIK